MLPFGDASKVPNRLLSPSLGVSEGRMLGVNIGFGCSALLGEGSTNFCILAPVPSSLEVTLCSLRGRFSELDLSLRRERLSRLSLCSRFSLSRDPLFSLRREESFSFPLRDFFDRERRGCCSESLIFLICDLIGFICVGGCG